MKKEVLNEEEVKEEQQSEVTEAVKPEEDINSLFPGAEPIEKPEPNTPPYDDVIERARLEFSKLIKKNRVISYVLMAVVFLFSTTTLPGRPLRGWPGRSRQSVRLHKVWPWSHPEGCIPCAWALC